MAAKRALAAKSNPASRKAKKEIGGSWRWRQSAKGGGESGNGGMQSARQWLAAAKIMAA